MNRKFLLEILLFNFNYVQPDDAATAMTIIRMMINTTPPNANHSYAKQKH
jgi:hypothetical protein